MRNKVNVFYYPETVASWTTLKKAILLFDEIHFMDRPSFMFGPFGGAGQFGTIGMASPLRQYEASFRAEGVPLFVHSAPGGPVMGDFYEKIKADINDPVFLARFQEGIKTSRTFRDLQIAHGNYGQFGTHENVAQKVISVSLSEVLSKHDSAMALFEDSAVHPFDLSTPLGCAKNLVSAAPSCSAKINFALNVSASEEFIPLADAPPYRDLLGTKYARAVKALEPAKDQIQVTDLTFSIFDELVPSERLDEMTFKNVIDYRKASENARQEFLEYLSSIQAKLANIGAEGDYSGAINQIIKTEIMPAANRFNNKLRSINESLYGALAKGVIGYAGGLTLYGDISWERLLLLAGAAGAYVAKSGIDALLAERAAKRECSVSYVLSLDN